MADEFKIEVHKRELSNKKSDLKTYKKHLPKNQNPIKKF